MQSLQLTLQTSLLHRKKILLITPEFVKYNGINFSKFEIGGLRYEVKGINGYRVRIGRLYRIDIQSLTGSILKIRMISLYRIRRKSLDEKYTAILKALFENFMNDISRDYIAKFKNGTEFILLGVMFTEEGIKLEKTTEMIPWFDVSTRNYRTYYSIFSITNPNTYKTFSYANDWKTSVLYSVSRYILKAKGFLRNE